MTLHQPLQIHEAVAFLLILAGYVPVLIAFTRRTSTKYFFTAYTLLLIGAFATNLEGYYPDGSTFATGLNYVEHGIGIFAAALFFFLAAYKSRQKSRDIAAKIPTDRFASDGGGTR